jgi:hypothetical protein
MALKTLTLATLDTANYSFAALGETKGQATRAMQAAWRRHRAQTGAEMRWDDVKGDVNYADIRPGQCLRDGSPLATSAA